MKAIITWNARYNMWDGAHCDKVLSRCKTIEAVRQYFLKRGFDVANIIMPTNVPMQPTQNAVLPLRPSVGVHIHQQIKEHVLEVCEKANTLYPQAALKDVGVSFYSRGCVAGKAHFRQNRVSFNEVLAAENGDHFKDTVKHEIAHLVTHRMYPMAKAHGWEFKNILLRLGGNGKTCHNYDVSSVKEVRSYRKWVCQCGCSTPHLVTQRVAARAQHYKCRKCATKLTFTGQTRMVTR